MTYSCPPEGTGRKTAPSVSRRALRIQEFCEQYGVSRSFAYKLIEAGTLKTVCIGRRRLIPLDAAEALLREGA
jgi:excisionase family DNA binding protein